MLLVVLALFPSPLLPSQTKGAASKPSGAHTASASNFDALVKKADAARASYQTDEAIRLYNHAVKIKPAYVEGWWYLGMLYYEADQYPEGRAAFRHVTGLKPEMALAWAMLGLCEFEIKEYDSSLVHLEHADQLGIPNEQNFYDVAQFHLTLLLVRSGRFELAIKNITLFARLGKDSPQFVEAMGLAALRKPLLPSELPPTEREMVLDVGQAVCDSAARRAAKVSTDLATLINKYPNTPEIHYVVGAMMLPSDSDKAIEEWKAELAISPDHPRALVSIAGEYLKRGEYQTALPFAEKAVASDAAYFPGHAVLGQVLAEGDLDVPRGVQELETAVRQAPWQPQVHFALGTAYAKAGRKQDAAKERAEFLRLRSQDEVAVSKP